MASNLWIRIPVSKLVFVLLMLSHAYAEQSTPPWNNARETSDAKACQCLLVVNYDMRTGRPCLNIVNSSQSPHPVVCDADVRDDTTVYITLYLPYTWPDRGHTLPDTCFPVRSFHLYLFTEVDSVHYFIEFDANTGHMQPVAIKPAGFLGIAQVKAYPANIVMIQVAGSDHQLATEISEKLKSSGQERVLDPGYYCGVPRRIRVAMLGAKQFNETVDGRLLAIELREPLNEETYAAIKSLVDAHNLAWFHLPLATRP